MPVQNALLVFVKTPKINYVKTRLASHLKPDEILALYTAFLKDIDTRFRKLNNIDFWYVISPENLNIPDLSDHIDIKNYFIQQGESLGDRMCNAFNHLANLNYTKLVLIGSDIPDISLMHISDALQSLTDTDCVIGPTYDGGYYLIATKKCHPGLFQNIEWSTDKVLDQTLIQAKESGLSVKLINRLSDVDTFEDLQHLSERLAQIDRKSADFPVNTWRVINQINF